MRAALATPVLLLTCLGCSTVTPVELADSVRLLPGKKDLRIGLVVLSDGRNVREAFADPPAAPGGAAPLAAAGVRYSDLAVLPDSLGEESVQRAVADLRAFTDVVPLSFDARGVVSRDALIQRVQDRLWPVAADQELDALLLVEGVRDHGLTWSDADESLFSLDTVLWWLAWPLGGMIPDRSYRPDVTLVASLFSLNDRRAIPEPFDASAGARATSLRPWTRAGSPLLSLVVPPVWLADDAAEVATRVGAWSRDVLPLELVRNLKAMRYGDAPDVSVVATRGEHGVRIAIESPQEVVEAILVALPRGALTEPAEPRVVAISSQVEPLPQGTRYRTTGELDEAELQQSARPLLHARITFASGETVSRTWEWADLAVAPR